MQKFIETEIDYLTSNAATKYLDLHPEIGYSTGLWYFIKELASEHVQYDYGQPDYIDMETLEDSVKYYINQPHYSKLLKKSIMKARKQAIEQDFK